MAYKNIEDKRKNAREYHKKNKGKINRARRENKKRNRLDFFNGKLCAICGSSENLELHHKDPSEKESHDIWGWELKRRERELEKCEILCMSCHKKCHREMMSNWNSKLTKEDIVLIKEKLISGEVGAKIAKEFGVGRGTISKIKLGKIWKDI